MMKKKKNSTNFFGVYIDDRLSWKDRISNVCKKTFMCLGILNKVKYILNTNFVYALYYALTLQYHTYCI